MRRLISACCWAAHDRYLVVRRRYKSLPHLPTFVVLFILWLYYQVYACGYVAFVEADAWKQLVFGPAVCVGITLTAASLMGTTLQRFPRRPLQFAVPADFFELEREKQRAIVGEVIARTGLNRHHVRGVCETCMIVRPERSHHCGVCDRCTPRLDHHCVVLHKCIHYKNTKQFALFFFWKCFSLVVALGTLHGHFMRSLDDLQRRRGSFHFSSFLLVGYSNVYGTHMSHMAGNSDLSLITLVFMTNLAYFLLIIFGFVFANFLWWCVIKNHTILACNKATRMRRGCPPMFLKDMKTACFRKPTIVGNVKVIFGRRWWEWLVPTTNGDTDGWRHECTCGDFEVRL
ncbi:Palmitoyltransferase [Aphelenchoides fujianensis]|nr:Palmitoyltransferase [Aphelenchoides fujianensis]